MMDKGLIAAKRQHVQDQIAALFRHEKVQAKVGGAVVRTLGNEIRFQSNRIIELDWADSPGRTDQQVRDRIAQLEATLTPEELACKYGNVRGLSQQAVDTIARIEILEVALGVHPGARGKVK